MLCASRLSTTPTSIVCLPHQHEPKNATFPESKQLAEILQICKMFDSHTNLQSKKHTCFGEISVQGLIASMQLVTSMQFLRVFCQTNSLIMTQ